jgi:hypothetical protein
MATGRQIDELRDKSGIHFIGCTRLVAELFSGAADHVERFLVDPTRVSNERAHLLFRKRR